MGRSLEVTAWEGDRKGGCGRDRKRDPKKERSEGGLLRDGRVFLRGVFLRVLRKAYWLNLGRKLRTKERRVVGKSLGHGAEKGNFQV